MYNIYIWDLISVVDQLLKATKISIYIQYQLKVQELQMSKSGNFCAPC